MKQPPDGWEPDEREALDELQPELDAVQTRHPALPPIDMLRAARHDALPADLQAKVERHLSEDAWARTLVDGLDGAEPPLSTAEEDRLLARIQLQAGDGRHAGPRRYAAFALAAAAVVTIAVWLIPATPRVAPPAETPSAPAPQAAPPAAARVELPLDHPSIVLSLTALRWRGGGSDNPLLRDLKGPLETFERRDYAGADREFAALEARYAGSVEVFFYGGVARLFLGDAPRALPALERAANLADTTFAPRVSWYRAIAEHRTGKVGDARARLETLCRAREEYASRACEAVERLDAARKDAR